MDEIVAIDRMSYGSAAIGRLSSGKTVFVEGAVPGDVVRIAVDREKAAFANAHAVDVLEASPLRVTAPVCAGACTGCPWSSIDYEAQLRFKRASVEDALKRVAHMPQDRIDETLMSALGSKHEWGYRNKLELNAFRDEAGRFTLGYVREGTHDPVAVQSCPLGNRLLEKAPKALTGALRYLEGSGDLGVFRVGVRGSLRTKDVEIALWTEPSAFPRAAAVKTLRSALKCTSIVRVLAQPGSARRVRKVEALWGKGCWAETLNAEVAGTHDAGAAEYLTSAPSFFQVNTAQAEKLVREVLDGLQVEEGSYIADLYAGGGTFSIPLARAGADVVAVESAASSVRDLRRNAEINHVEIDVVGGDAAIELPELGELDGLVVDPPRAGLAKGVVASIAAAGPDRVAYVSCDPQTWARDAALFEEHGYRLVSARPVDMFPQTFHIEVVSIFERTKTHR